jgi:hypothetical protein
MTTSPDGQPVTITDRLHEIRARYVPSHSVTHAITASATELTAAVHRVQARLDTARTNQQ